MQVILIFLHVGTRNDLAVYICMRADAGAHQQQLTLTGESAALRLAIQDMGVDSSPFLKTVDKLAKFQNLLINRLCNSPRSSGSLAQHHP